MPLHDHKCQGCGRSFEEFVKWDERIITCGVCGGTAIRVYNSFRGISNSAPTWMKDTVAVVDKDGGSHCQEFIKHQTRDTYKNWMRGEGLRPIEPGEKLVKPKADTSDIRKKVKENFRRRNTITVRG